MSSICALRKGLAYLRHLAKSGRVVGHIDYTWSDYHAAVGIPAQDLLRQLEICGTRTVFYEPYRTRNSSVLALLESRWGASQPRTFRFIVQSQVAG